MCRIFASLSLVAFLLISVSPAFALDETFTDDPIAAGRAAVTYGPISSSAPSGAPTTYVWNSSGSLTEYVNTNWRLDGGYPDTSNYVGDSSRLAWNLPKTYTQDDSFSFGATLNIKSLSAYPEQYMAINFGLVNSTTTIMDRTGYPDPNTGWSTNANCFDSVEWSFFPNQSTFGWPTLQQTVIGSNLYGPDSAFYHMAANFNLSDAEDGGFDTVLSQEKADPTHPLYGNTYGLPLNTPMAVTMTYDGTTKILSMLITEADTGLVLVDNVDTLPDLDITSPIGGWGSVSSFAVDQLAIMNYQDGNNVWGDDPSIVANIEYSRIWFEEASEPSPAVPEPGGLALLGLAAFGLTARRKRSL